MISFFDMLGQFLCLNIILAISRSNDASIVWDLLFEDAFMQKLGPSNGFNEIHYIKYVCDFIQPEKIFSNR